MKGLHINNLFLFMKQQTRLQILGSKAVNTKASHKPYYPPLYSSSMDCLIKTVRLEGTKGLFKGYSQLNSDL